MGFDPRRWDGIRGGSARVTVGADLRWMERQHWASESRSRDAEQDVWSDERRRWDGERDDEREVGANRRQDAAPRSRVTVGAAPGITPDTVRRWGEAMAAHPRWGALPLEALSTLAGRCHARGMDPSLPLEEALERRSPGLGRELRWALGGPRSRARLAVRAAFALHGPRAADRLDRRPLELVDELLAACGVDASQSWRQSQDPGQGHREGQNQGRSGGGERRQTTGSGRNDNRSSGSNQSGGPRPGSAGQGAIDPRRREALTLLGLEPGASPAAVKAAHRRLVKRHHPDVGGDAEAFRRVDAAYRLLIA